MSDATKAADKIEQDAKGRQGDLDGKEARQKAAHDEAEARKKKEATDKGRAYDPKPYQRTSEDEEQQAFINGMMEVVKALRDNPASRPGSVIPKVRDPEAADRDKRREEASTARSKGQADLAKSLERQAELIQKEIDGKTKAGELV
jgi:hypothetical protein